MCVDVEVKVYTKHPQKHRLRKKNAHRLLAVDTFSWML